MKDIGIYVFHELQKKATQFVPDFSSCILGVYNTNIDNSRIMNTVMLLVKMDAVNGKYYRNVLSTVAFTKKRFMYNVMLLGVLYDNDVFLSVIPKMYAET